MLLQSPIVTGFKWRPKEWDCEYKLWKRASSSELVHSVEAHSRASAPLHWNPPPPPTTTTTTSTTISIWKFKKKHKKPLILLPFPYFLRNNFPYTALLCLVVLSLSGSSASYLQWCVFKAERWWKSHWKQRRVFVLVLKSRHFIFAPHFIIPSLP